MGGKGSCTGAEPGSPARNPPPRLSCPVRYWERLRGERCAPGACDLDGQAILGVQPWLGVLDQDDASAYRWRVAGTGIARLWAGDVTGTSLTAGWPDFDRQVIQSALDGAIGRRRAFVARLQAASSRGEEVGIELLCLPVEASDGAPRQVLCGLFPFRTPDWLGKRPLAQFELTSLRPIHTEPVSGRPVVSAPAAVRTSVALTVIRGGLSE